MSSFDIRRARRCIVALAIVAMSSLSLAGAQAAQLVNTTPDGVAMDGYDPVNYFTEQKAAKGSSDFHAEWNGATYWFVSAEHRDAFAANPAKYAPQYNGWCAWAVSEGYAAEVDVIDGWLVHDGKLYVNWDKKVRDSLKAELDSRLAKGEQNWPTVETGLQKGTIDIARHADYPKDNPDNIAHPQ
jgi:YHS domain-containing protein